MKKYLEDDDGGLLTDPLFQRLFRKYINFLNCEKFNLETKKIELEFLRKNSTKNQ